MKDLSVMTIEQRAFYLAKRAYAAEWRKKNREKLNEYQRNFYLKQGEKKSMSETPKSDND